MSDNNLLKYKIGLGLIPLIGPVTAKKLISYCGSLEGVFKQKKSALEKIPGIGKVIAEKIYGQNVLDRAEKEIEFIEKNKVSWYFYLDDNYPERLRNCEDAPIIFFSKGNLELNAEKIISVVGTRNATNYGIDICNNLMAEIKNRNHSVTIVSGLAYGIDIHAHKAAIKNKLATIAVLGHGLDKLYPAAHKSTSLEMQQKGGLVCEYLSKTIPEPQNFVKRNRIIAGLADATVVIESGYRGGALITADIASSYNRDVFAYPGNIDNKYSVGCNRLIKSNKAALIEGVKDLEYILGWEVDDKKKKSIQPTLFYEFSSDEKTIVSQFKDNKELPFDTIFLNSNLPVSKVSAVLLNLEFAGVVSSLPGKVYRLNGSVPL